MGQEFDDERLAGEFVRIVSGPFAGLRGEVVVSQRGWVLLRIDEGVYVRLPDGNMNVTQITQAEFDE